MADQLNKVADRNEGALYEVNSFVVPVLKGTNREMGVQYGYRWCARPRSDRLGGRRHPL